MEHRLHLCGNVAIHISDASQPNSWIDLAVVIGFVIAAKAPLGILVKRLVLRQDFVGASQTHADAKGAVVYTEIVSFTLVFPGEFNANGSVDGDDVIAFFERWSAGFERVQFADEKGRILVRPLRISQHPRLIQFSDSPRRGRVRLGRARRLV